MNLLDAELGRKYEVVSIESDDDELNGFLLTLGCYSGSSITVVSKISKSYVVSIKDGRYNIDADLAEVIMIK